MPSGIAIKTGSSLLQRSFECSDGRIYRDNKAAHHDPDYMYF